MQKVQDSFDGTFTDNIRGQAYKAQWANKKNKVVINVCDTQYAVVKHVGKKNRWYLQTQPFHNLTFDLCWTDNHVKPDLFARMQPHQKINHFPGMTILSRKNNLGNSLMQFRKKFPGDYQFFPITWSLPNDYADLQAYHDCRQQGKAQTFIVKPQASCQGRGIYLTRNIEKIKYDRCVVQRYMHKPYLIDGLKFDMRIYVLVAGIDPLRIFVYEQGLARFATEQYKPPRSQNLDNKFMHLTNYAINKDNPKFIFNQSITNMDVGHKRSLTSVYKKIGQDGHDVDELKAKINDIFIKTIITGYPTLSNSVSSVHPDNFANDMCFQILGFDVMIDHKLNPYLLEINYTPSFTADTPLDQYIKKNLISDSLQLLNINDKWKKQMKQKRDKQIQQRMMSGKRRKYTPQQRQQLIIQQARKRDQYQLQNLGRFTKIFILNQDQLNTYKRYYDYSMQLYNISLKTQNNSSMPITYKLKQIMLYNYYYEPKNQKKNKKQQKQKQNYMKNNSKIIRQNQKQMFNNKSGQTQASFMSVSVNKRVSSANSKKQKKERKVIYDRISSKKSLKNEQYGRSNQEYDNQNGIENVSIFTNKNLQQLILKQRQSQNIDHDDDDQHQHDFN